MAEATVDAERIHAVVFEVCGVPTVEGTVIDVDVRAVRGVEGREQHAGAEAVTPEDVVAFRHDERHQVRELVAFALDAGDELGHEVGLRVLDVDLQLGEDRNHGGNRHVEEVGGFPEHLLAILHFPFVNERLIEGGLEAGGDGKFIAHEVGEPDVLELFPEAFQFALQFAGRERSVFGASRFTAHEVSRDFLVFVFLL